MQVQAMLETYRLGSAPPYVSPRAVKLLLEDLSAAYLRSTTLLPLNIR